MSHFHAVVWIDHAEAHVLHFTLDEAERSIVHAHGKHRNIHHHAGTLGSGKAPEDTAYFAKVASSLAGAQEILLTGPANEKIEFRKYLEAHARPLAAAVVAVQTSDHPTDGELLRHARKYFVAADRMHVER
jgi:stalled ribosome rescue protein Dom34